MLELIKHNKIKNTGIIYLVLVKKMILLAMHNQFGNAYKIFNKFFNKNKLLGKLLTLYNNLTIKKYNNLSLAKSLLLLTLNQRMKLDDVRLLKLKYFLIKLIKKYYDIKLLFSSTILNYKLYASTYKVFLSLKKMQYNPANIVESKHMLILFMIKPLSLQYVDLDVLLFKKQSTLDKLKILLVFVNKYNLKFDFLNLKQKNIIRMYAYLFSNNKSIQNFINLLLDLFKKLNLNSSSLLIIKLVLNINSVKSIKNLLDKVYALLNIYLLGKI